MHKKLHSFHLALLVSSLYLLPFNGTAQTGNTCSSLIALSCSTSITGTTIGGGNEFTKVNYSCHTTNNPFDAEDKVFSITPTLSGTHEINLTGLNKDLDMFLFSGSCTAGSCLAKSTNSLTTNEKLTISLTAGTTYYLVIDGYATTQAGNFTVRWECPSAAVCLPNIPELTCGHLDTFSTIGKSNNCTAANYTSCMTIQNASFNAGDLMLKYRHTASNPKAVVTIWDYTKDLDLFLFNTCLPNAGCVRAAKNKQDKYEYIDLTGLPYGDYYLVIDGYDAAQVSKFLISISCQYVCNPSGLSTEMGCNQTIQGTTTSGTNFFTKYGCDPSYEFTGPEKYFVFKAPHTDTFVFDLFGFTNDLELFITETVNCKPNPICKASSLQTSGKPEKIKIVLHKDETINVIVDGSLGDSGPFQLKVTCPEINRCAEVESLSCGNEYNSTTTNAGNDFIRLDYADCHQTNAPYTAPDKVFKYTHTAQNKNAQVVLWGYTGDLDLFLLKSCGEDANCVDCSASAVRKYEVIDFSNKPYGDYYIVVDGAASNQSSAFKISISCGYACSDNNIPLIACNATINGNTSNGINRFSKYSCSNEAQFTGKEKFYRFTAVHSGEHTIDLTGFTNDMELFIVDNIQCVYSPVCKAKSNKGPGEAEQIKINLAQNQSIDIVVDGALGDQGPFTLKVSCPVVSPIQFDVSDTVCAFSGDTVQVAVKVKNFKNVTSFSMTVQSDQPSVAQIKSVSSSLSTFTYFVHEVNKTITLTFLSNTPVTLPDGQTAFFIQTVLAGSGNQSANLKIINTPTVIKAVVTENGQNSLYPVEVFDGSICVKTRPPSKLVFDIDDAVCDKKGKNIQIPVRVTGFKNIRSFSMTVTVDSTSILEINNLSSPLSGMTSFESTTKKTFTLTWLSNTGVSLNDGSIVFYINGTLKGNPVQTALLSIISSPTNIQAVTFENNQNISVPVEVKGGSACVNGFSVIDISGKVYNRANEGIKNAIVRLRGSDSVDVTTPATGSYSFNSVAENGNFTISVLKNTDPKNGIDLLDLALLQDHIITRTVLTDPFKLLAADINRDGAIDILDLAELQDLILTRISAFINNTSWIFIPTDETLTATKVFNKTYRTTRVYANPGTSQINQDFYGVKIGDIDASASTQTLVTSDQKISSMIESRSVGKFTMTLPSMQVQKDQLIYIPVMMEKFEDVRVFQFKINWDPFKLAYQGVGSYTTLLEGFNESNLVYHPENPGVLNSLWLHTNNNSLPEKSKLFVMTFKVLAQPGETVSVDIQDAKAMEVGGLIQPVQTNNGRLTVTALSTRVKEPINRVKMQVYPNPTSTTLTLSADTPFEVLNMMDLTGKTIPWHAPALRNHTLDLSSYPSGVYYLKTKAGTDISIWKVVVNK